MCVKYGIARPFKDEPDAPEPRESRNKKKNYAYALKRYKRRLALKEKGETPERKVRVTRWQPFYESSLSIISDYLSKYPDSTYEDLEEALVTREYAGQKLTHFHAYMVEDSNRIKSEVVEPFAFLPSKGLLKKLCKEKNLPSPKRSRIYVDFDNYLPLARSLIFTGSTYREVHNIVSSFYYPVTPTYVGLYLWMKRNAL
jgi:hypothetical protein